jgi:hypothetical protein
VLEVSIAELKEESVRIYSGVMPISPPHPERVLSNAPNLLKVELLVEGVLNDV